MEGQRERERERERRASEKVIEFCERAESWDMHTHTHTHTHTHITYRHSYGAITYRFSYVHQCQYSASPTPLRRQCPCHEEDSALVVYP
jgi:hypothetical protein